MHRTIVLVALQENGNTSRSAGDWHTLWIVQQGKEFKGYLDGRLLLDGSDGLFTQAACYWTGFPARARMLVVNNAVKDRPDTILADTNPR